MEYWIPLTIIAAFLQNLRSTLQKSIQPQLGTRGATYVRFAFGTPVALVLLVSLLRWRGDTLPTPTFAFLSFSLVGGLAQVLATGFLLASFRSRHFAAGIAYSKTEPLLAAVFGLIVLGETIPARGTAALLLGTVAVLVLTMGSKALQPRLWSSLFRDRGAVLGILAGAGFGLAAVCYRGAGLSLESGDVLLRALFTLACVLSLQTIFMTGEMAIRAPGTFRKIARHWQHGAAVGLVGACASAGWFTASLMANAAYVRALGQVELVFAIGSSVLLFGERLQRHEVLGIGLLGFALFALLAT